MLKNLIETTNSENNQEKRFKLSSTLKSALCVAVISSGIIITIDQILKVRNIAKRLAKAENLMSNLEYDDAIHEYRTILDINPKLIEAYLGLADAYVGLDRIDKACRVLRDGLKITNNQQIRDKLNDLAVLEALFAMPCNSDNSTKDKISKGITTDDFGVFTMPDIVGMDFEEVKCTYPNIRFAFSFEPSSEQLADCIISTTPESGTQHNISQEVYVKVSTGSIDDICPV